jgi:two-component system phosphate regulon sensor histidine kinase PhoR
MLSHRIRFIIIIVSLSLFGIIVLQGYWLYNTYRISAKQLEKDIAGTLQNLRDLHGLREMRASGLLDQTNKQSIKPEDLSLLSYLQSTASSVRFSAGKTDSGKLVINTKYDFSQQEFNTLRKGLKAELDSLLSSQQIHIVYTYALRKNTGLGRDYLAKHRGLDTGSNYSFRIKLGLAQPYILELQVQDPNRQIILQMQWILLASLVIISMTIGAYLYMLSTIFQQKKLAELRNDFVNNMTHELKTPIATVALAVEALRSFGVADNPIRREEYLDMCSAETRRLSLIVDKVLTFAALEKSEINFHVELVDLNFLIEEVVATVALQLRELGATINLKLPNKGLELDLDTEHFSAVLYNLIDNSLKYAVRNIVIEISVQSGDNAVELIFSDNGIGIPALYQDKVFDAFFRVPQGNLHNVKGFGLGLSYVAEIIKKHKGNIRLESKENEFSCFTIHLPLSQKS